MLLNLSNIHKGYKTDKFTLPVLKGIDLSINVNEYVSIMGPSGSGKTTLLHLLGLLDTPTTGEYIFDSVNTRSLNHYQLSELRNLKIGFIFQSFNLLPKLNAQKNVEMPLIYQTLNKARRVSAAKEALERVGLSGRLDHKPSEMSGGEQQRVAIARALVSRPKLILADEPTGNLDTKTGKEVMKLFQELHSQGNSIILITHDDEVANCATRKITLRDGLIID